MQLQTGPAESDSQRRRQLFAIDIETRCGVDTCQDPDCDHALNHTTNEITVIAAVSADYRAVFRGPNKIEQLQKLLDDTQCNVTFHNGKFDLRTLIHNGLNFDLNRWTDDSMLQAFVCQEKIPDTWLADYEQQRTALNKKRKHLKHRTASHHSLKTLAPYFLNVPPFWEPEMYHDDDAYVLTDAEYTYRLTLVLEYKLRAQGDRSYKFYKTNLLRWAKTLLIMELSGITLDILKLKDMWLVDERNLSILSEKINTQWQEHFDAYKEKQQAEVHEKYLVMRTKREQEGTFGPKTAEMYRRNEQTAMSKIEGLNLDSPTQLKWLLTERLGLPAVDINGDESTNKETLQRLSLQNKEIESLVQYRKKRKLLTSFYPDYMARASKSTNGLSKIHTNFNITGARTGRLSSSGPNLQQVPGELHQLFTAEPGNVLITRDLSAIEPTVLAYYSEDPQLAALLISGGDFHGTNAATMFGLDCDPKEVKTKYPLERRIAKTVGLAVLYGAGAQRVLQTLKQADVHTFSLAECKDLVYRLRKFYSGVWEFKLQLDAELESGAILHNLMDRPFKIQNAEDVYMKGLNTLIQGSASDLMQQAASDILDLGYSPKLIVHDELVVEVPKNQADKAEQDVIREMTKFQLPTKFGLIPIKTEGKVAETWSK